MTVDVKINIVVVDYPCDHEEIRFITNGSYVVLWPPRGMPSIASNKLTLKQLIDLYIYEAK